MERTIYLAQVLGPALVILGAAMAIRRRHYAAVFAELAEARLLRTLFFMIELVAGLFLVAAHNSWSPLPAAVLTLLGWMAVLEATLYLFIPDPAFERILSAFNRPAWYAGGGTVTVLIGLYLAGFGFGVW